MRFLGNINTASPLGQGSTAANARVVLNQGALHYTGPGESSNRRFELANQDSTFYADGTGPLTLSGRFHGHWLGTARILYLRGAQTDDQRDRR